MGSQRYWQGLDLRGYRRSRCLLIFVLLALPLSATTYYVDNCVTVGSDSNNGTSTSTPWLTIAHVNAQTFNPEDSVLFQSTCTWREQLVPPSSGSSASPITFGAYGSGALPRILGSTSANSTSNWTNLTGNVWYTPASATPNVLWRDTSTVMTLVASQSALNADGQWWYDSTNLRVDVYSTVNPASLHTFEIPQRNYGVWAYDKSYVTVQNLSISYANVYDVMLDGNSGSSLGNQNVIINGITAQYAAHHGIAVVGNYNGTTASDNNIVENCTVAYNGWTGIQGGYDVSGLTVLSNIVHDNAWDTAQNYSAGIRVVGGEPGTNNGGNMTIQNNQVYSNGIGQTNSSGTGIHLDTTGTGNVVQYNLVYNNRFTGISVELTTSAVASYNISYGNLTGMYLARGDNGVAFYNNTMYNNTTNLVVEGQTGTGFPVINNLIQNNITESGTTQLRADIGGDNGTDGSGNVYTYNSFGTAGTNFITWGASKYSTYASWEAATGNCGKTGCSHSIQTAPTFTNAGSNNFTLISGSSAIASGTNLGSTYQMGLSSSSLWPSSVSTLNQNSHGSGWEIGAFVFGQHTSPAPPTSLSVTVY